MFQRISAQKTEAALDFDIHLAPGKRVYCFVGRNGVGKTSLLEHLARTLLPGQGRPLGHGRPLGLAVPPGPVPSDGRSFEVETMLRFIEELDPKLFAGLSTRAADGSFPSVHRSESGLSFAGTPLDKLPSGVLAVMKLVHEILCNLANCTAPQEPQERKNLDALNDIVPVEPIVLIDEIEAHLHPTWQAKIVPLLKRFFPQATFYLCTHSPLVVATTDDGEAYELVREGQRVTAHKLGNPRAWYMADVYEQAFHVELPGADDAVSVPDLLLDFSLKVKDLATDTERFAAYWRASPLALATTPDAPAPPATPADPS
jgi:hypothetical protein